MKFSLDILCTGMLRLQVLYPPHIRGDLYPAWDFIPLLCEEDTANIFTMLCKINGQPYIRVVEVSPSGRGVPRVSTCKCGYVVADER